MLKTCPDRTGVVLTATKSGDEINFARLGDYLSQAILDLSSDLDKDSQVSLLEAFLKASRMTQEVLQSRTGDSSQSMP